MDVFAKATGATIYSSPTVLANNSVSPEPAQAPIPTPITVYPSYWGAAGVGYGANESPRVSGLVSFGYKLNANSYSYTTQQIIPSKGLILTSVRSGIAPIVFTFGRIVILGLGDVGGATSNTGGLLGAFSGGGIVTLNINKSKKLYLAGDLRILKIGNSTFPTYSFLFGKGI
jgi:hypothetical protein